MVPDMSMRVKLAVSGVKILFKMFFLKAISYGDIIKLGIKMEENIHFYNPPPTPLAV